LSSICCQLVSFQHGFGYSHGWWIFVCFSCGWWRWFLQITFVHLKIN
jgi:hypothetical protein